MTGAPFAFASAAGPLLLPPLAIVEFDGVRFLSLLFLLAVLVHHVRAVLPGSAPIGAESRRRVRRILLAGAAAWLLAHVAAVDEAIGLRENLRVLGDRVTFKDQVIGVLICVQSSWWGNACLLLCLLSAVDRLLAGRGRPLVLPVAVAAVVLVLLFGGAEEDRLARWDPSPVAVTEPVEWQDPPMFLATDCIPHRAEYGLLLQPALQLLLLPAGAVAVLALLESLRAAAGRRPWKTTPSDPALLCACGAALGVAVLFAEGVFMERATALTRWANPTTKDGILLQERLVEGFPLAVAPAAVVAVLALTVLLLVMLDRLRGKTPPSRPVQTDPVPCGGSRIPSDPDGASGAPGGPP
ncbi:MAG: hypothetical protein HUU06_12325 [Planctomycetaceae bacterium]|nr:hypothetical protein [Planctomycetota bacterium]NUN53554.1 hypothetical protein [Planctomycetaceae bacterium]